MFDVTESLLVRSVWNHVVLDKEIREKLRTSEEPSKESVIFDNDKD